MMTAWTRKQGLKIGRSGACRIVFFVKKQVNCDAKRQRPRSVSLAEGDFKYQFAVLNGDLAWIAARFVCVFRPEDCELMRTNDQSGGQIDRLLIKTNVVVGFKIFKHGERCAWHPLHNFWTLKIDLNVDVAAMGLKAFVLCGDGRARFHDDEQVVTLDGISASRFGEVIGLLAPSESLRETGMEGVVPFGICEGVVNHGAMVVRVRFAGCE